MAKKITLIVAGIVFLFSVSHVLLTDLVTKKALANFKIKTGYKLTATHLRVNLLLGTATINSPTLTALSTTENIQTLSAEKAQLTFHPIDILIGHPRGGFVITKFDISQFSSVLPLRELLTVTGNMTLSGNFDGETLDVFGESPQLTLSDTLTIPSPTFTFNQCQFSITGLRPMTNTPALGTLSLTHSDSTADISLTSTFIPNPNKKEGQLEIKASKIPLTTLKKYYADALYIKEAQGNLSIEGALDIQDNTLGIDLLFLIDNFKPIPKPSNVLYQIPIQILSNLKKNANGQVSIPLKATSPLSKPEITRHLQAAFTEALFQQ